MHINRALFDVNMVSPDFVQQLATAVYALGMPQKILQELELGRPEF